MPALQDLFHLAPRDLPVLWDCDFMLGPKDGEGRDSYVLCEINASSVSPFPEWAFGGMVEAVLKK